MQDPIRRRGEPPPAVFGDVCDGTFGFLIMLVFFAGIVFGAILGGGEGVVMAVVIPSLSLLLLVSHCGVGLTAYRLNHHYGYRPNLWPVPSAYR